MANTKFTRRNALTAIPACGLAAIVPASAQAFDLQDAELLRLEAEFSAAYDRFDAATHRHSEIESRVYAAKPPKPAEPPMPKELSDAVVKLSIEQFRDTNNLVCQAMARHREEYRQIFAAWETECATIERDNSLPEAEAEQNRLMFEASDAAEAVLDVPAKTLAGILIKLRVHDRWTFDADDILASITADIEAMAGVRS